MPREDDWVRWQRGQLLEAGVHGVGVTSGEVRSPTPFQKKCVAGYQPPAVHQKALAAGGVPGGVQQPDGHRADVDHVVMVMADQVGGADPGGAPYPFGFVAVYVYRNLDTGEQILQAGQGEAEHVATDVIGMVVRDQHTGEPHTIVGKGGEDVVDRVRRVDHDRVPSFLIADQIGEVDHLSRYRIADREVAPGQQLTEVQTFDHGLKATAAAPSIQPAAPPDTALLTFGGSRRAGRTTIDQSRLRFRAIR